jgi:hypothetical protein
MIRDRAGMFCGGVLALLSALVLVFAGGRLLDVIGTLTATDHSLANDLNIARVSVLGLGIGLTLVIFALALAKRSRHIQRLGQLGLVCAGLLTLLAGAVVFAGFESAAADLAEVEQLRHLNAGSDELPSDVAEILRDRKGGLVGGFGLLLGGMLVLSLSLWSLFWSPVSPAAHDRWTRPTALTGATGALLWTSLLAAATLTGAAAIQSGPPRASPAFAETLRNVNLTLLLTRVAAIGLVLYGAALTLIGMTFRVHSQG